MSMEKLPTEIVHRILTFLFVREYHNDYEHGAMRVCRHWYTIAVYHGDHFPRADSILWGTVHAYTSRHLARFHHISRKLRQRHRILIRSLRAWRRIDLLRSNDRHVQVDYDDSLTASDVPY